MFFCANAHERFKENRQIFNAEARCPEVRRSARLQLLCFCWVLAGTFLEAQTGDRALFFRAASSERAHA